MNRVSGATSINSVLATSSSSHLSAPAHQCPSGAPPQWRHHMDIASKAHLAPLVALGSLRHLRLTPIQLHHGAVAAAAAVAGGQHQQALRHHAPQQVQSAESTLAQHAQNVNNEGVIIEATFQIIKVIKRAQASPSVVRPMEELRLAYKVSASLSTNATLLSAATAPAALYSARMSHASDAAAATRRQVQAPRAQLRTLTSAFEAQQDHVNECALELSELELERQVSKIFKLNQTYVLFLDVFARAPQQAAYIPLQPLQLSPSQQQRHNSYAAPNQQQQHQLLLPQLHQRRVVSAQLAPIALVPTAAPVQWSVHAFATHEPLTNGTSRALKRVLCCGK